MVFSSTLSDADLSNQAHWVNVYDRELKIENEVHVESLARVFSQTLCGSVEHGESALWNTKWALDQEFDIRW